MIRELLEAYEEAVRARFKAEQALDAVREAAGADRNESLVARIRALRAAAEGTKSKSEVG